MTKRNTKEPASVIGLEPASPPIEGPAPIRIRKIEPASSELMKNRENLIEVKLSIDDRGSVTIPVAAEGGRPPVFCLGIRKSGSTLLNKAVQYLAVRNDVHFVDIPGSCFRAGYKVADWIKVDVSGLVRPGNIYGGFRSFPRNLAETSGFKTGKKVFMFRDPRDALVSQYYSDAYSHSLPSAKSEAGKTATDEFLSKRAEALNSDINDYVLQHAPSMQRTVMDFAGLLEDPDCLVLRYEEYIFQKKRMLGKVVKHFDWEAKPGQVEQLLTLIDQVPTSEDKTKFVRNVVPGDHRRKLLPETIRKLDNKLADVMTRFDYY
jgi:hypothetical protein